MINYKKRNNGFRPKSSKFCFFLLLTFIWINNVSSQKVEVNERGDTIVTYLDGSWRYFNLADSSLLSPRVLGPLPNLANVKKRNKRVSNKSIKKNKPAKKDRVKAIKDDEPNEKKINKTRKKKEAGVNKIGKPKNKETINPSKRDKKRSSDQSHYENKLKSTNNSPSARKNTSDRKYKKQIKSENSTKKKQTTDRLASQSKSKTQSNSIESSKQKSQKENKQNFADKKRERSQTSPLSSMDLKEQTLEHKRIIKSFKKEKKSAMKTLQTGDLNDIIKKINAYYTSKTNALELAKREAFKLENLIKIVNTQMASVDKNSTSYANLKDQIIRLNASEKDSEKRIKRLEKQVVKAKQLTRANEAYQKKWLAKYERKNGQIDLEQNIPSLATPKVEIVKVDSSSKNKKRKTEIASRPNKKTAKTRYHPVPVMKTNYGYHDCNIAFVGTDKFSNNRRIDVAKQTLFEYTHDELRPYFKDKIYMTCKGFLSAQPGFKYLTLEFNIASDRAKQSFGTLQKGSLLTLKLIDGSYINLINTSDDFGTVDLQSKTTVYTGQYVIEKKQERELTNLELDQIRIMWTSGFEDYSIYEMDFFKNQFECLNSEY